MGLPRYVMNYDESRKFIQDAISEVKLTTPIEINMDTVDEIYLDTTHIESKINPIVTINQWINEKWEEISEYYQEILSEKVTELYESDKELYDSVLEGLDVEIDISREITDNLENIINQLNPIGEKRIKGFYRHLPALQTTHDFSLNGMDNEILITGIAYHLIGWSSFGDTISLSVTNNESEKEYFIQDISIKEVAEKKSFTRSIKVEKNNIVNVEFNNNSGNSKQVQIDIEYIII